MFDLDPKGMEGDENYEFQLSLLILEWISVFIEKKWSIL